MAYWTDENGDCACGRGAKVVGEADFAVGSCGPICELCVKEGRYVWNPETGMYWQPQVEKIVSVYQTNTGTKIEYLIDGLEGWTIEAPVTCVMHKATGGVFFFATENRGERVAKVAFFAYGRDLRETPVREFPESDYAEIVGWALGVVASALGGWETIWATFETALYPDA
jgi:hypothetical protein